MKIVNQENYLKYNIIEYDYVGSTMDVTKNYPFNTVVIAQEQANGRGKGDRVWNSSKNNNLYFSTILGANRETLDYSLLVFIVALAMQKSIKIFDGNNSQILSKWPNDILVNNKKVCGILLEFDRLNRNIVIGCGVNIDSYPDSAMFSATSLKNEGILIERYELLREFLNNLELLIREWETTGFSSIGTRWLAVAYRLNEEITVDGEKGIFKDLDKDGSLILELGNGQIKIVKSGDIF